VRAVVQRVSSAEVEVAGERIAQMDRGLLVLVGVGREDVLQDALELARKLVGLRIFEDAEGKMNRSLVDVAGTLGLVSQFTLWGDVRKGRRPSFGDAAEPEMAKRLFDALVEEAKSLDVPVVTGRFGASMNVSLVNAGPVTILLDTKRSF
jgi:D-tyrosyl-tRNA(Tyr) deacylase